MCYAEYKINTVYAYRPTHIYQLLDSILILIAEKMRWSFYVDIPERPSK